LAEVNALESAITLLGLSQTVFYLGRRNDIHRILVDSDIFVLPSLSEAFPLVILEAMAAGKPVISTDCGGPSEMVVDGETGFIVPLHDPQSLSAKILQLTASKYAIAEMGKKGRERYEQNFRAECYASNFAKLYLELAAKVKVVPLTKTERIVLNGFMDMYQQRAEQRLRKQIVLKLKNISKMFVALPLSALDKIRSWCKWKKRCGKR
jgi:hypothetical protein